MGLHHWHFSLSEEPQIGPQIGRNQCWGPWVSRISHWFWHMGQAHSLVAAMIQQSALSAFFLVVEPEFWLGSPEKWMILGGTPIFWNPPCWFGPPLLLQLSFFCCFNFPLFSMCVHQIPISVCPQWIFSSIQSHKKSPLKNGLGPSPLGCLNPPIKWPSFYGQIRQILQFLQGPAVGANERRAFLMPEVGWRRGGHTWLTKKPMENGLKWWSFLVLNGI